MEKSKKKLPANWGQDPRRLTAKQRENFRMKSNRKTVGKAIENENRAISPVFRFSEVGFAADARPSSGKQKQSGIFHTT